MSPANAFRAAGRASLTTAIAPSSETSTGGGVVRPFAFA